MSRGILAAATKRQTSSPTILLGKWVNFARTWAPLAVAGYVYFLAYQATGGSHPAAGALLLLTLTIAAFVYWRARVHRAKTDLPLGDVLLGLFHAWFLRKNWPRACDAAYLSRRRTLIVPPLRKVRVADDGTISATISNGRYGVTTEALVEESGKLAQFLGAYDVAVTDCRHAEAVARRRGRLSAVWRVGARLGPRSGVSRLRFYYDDPTGRLMRLSELPTSPAGTLAYGRRLDGSAAYIRQHISLFCFGMTGFGKSNLLQALLADALRKQVPIRLYVADPKMGMELQRLGAVCGAGTDTFQVRAYAKTPAESEKMIERAEGGMNKRMAEMAARGDRKHTPTKEEPLCIVILDEALKLKETLKKGDDSPLGRIVYTGRAAGYVVWALTQLPQKDVMGAVRDLIPQRICLAAPNRETTDAALGNGATASGAECHLIDTPGVGYSFVEGDRRPQKFRAPLVSDADADKIAQGVCPYFADDDEIKNEPHYVYRYWGVLPVDEYPEFGGDEVLLYVGVTDNWARRDAQHAEDKDWHQYVTRFEHDEVWPSEVRALAAEEDAITTEHPIFNTQHNMDNPLRREDRGVPFDDPRRQAGPSARWRAQASRGHVVRRSKAKV